MHPVISEAVYVSYHISGTLGVDIATRLDSNSTNLNPHELSLLEPFILSSG